MLMHDLAVPNSGIREREIEKKVLRRIALIFDLVRAQNGGGTDRSVSHQLK